MQHKTPTPLPRFKAGLFLAAAAALCVLLWCCADPYDGRILNNVHVAGIHVGGMTRREAKQALEAIALRYSREPMQVLLPEGTVTLSPEDTAVQLNISAAVGDAYEYGRKGTKQERQAALDASRTQAHHVDLLPSLTWEEAPIRSALEDYASVHDTRHTEASVFLEGVLPALDEASRDENAPGQTLVITMGTPEYALDVEALYRQVLDAYSSCVFQVDWRNTGVPAVAPDLEALYTQYHIEPVSAALDPQTFVYTPASYGYGFDLEAAQALADGAKPGSTLRIPMEYVVPETVREDFYYRDELGCYVSGHSDRPNIVKNLELVCQHLNGVIVQPGEVFSYNDTIGERTVERGFMYGESFTGMTRTRSAGGGVCQGSSVLHVCVLLADLEVVERANHGLTVGYTPLGQDAAVSWGGPDFQFRNTTNFPIQIVAELVEDGMQIRLLGTDEKSYYVELEATQGHDDHQIYANCYKRRYDKQTGELISRELACHSAYKYGG